MIAQKGFLNKLKEFGLNSYEAKIWTALLSRGVSTAGELSDISNVPRSRSYDVLENLEKKGFIVMKLGKPIKYIAVPPEEVLDRVKKRIKENAEKQSEYLDEVSDSPIMTELNLLHKQGVDVVEPTELTGSFKSRNHLYNQMELMMKAAETSITIMTTAEGLTRKADALKTTFEKAKKRGVSIKIAAPMSKETANAVRELSSVAELRNVPEIKARFCLVDGKELIFMLLDDKEVQPNYDAGIWATTPFFAKAMQDMFNTVWKEAETIKVTK